MVMKRKHVIFTGISILVGVALVFVLYTVMASTPTESYYKTTNPPEFYGLTKATIQVGDDFSLRDVRYRLFAKDFEDGDLTDKIVASSNVNTNVAGTYNIHYQVTDSHNNTTTKDVPITVVNNKNQNRYYERTMYTLPSVWNMALAGTNRGNNDDRQILGFYMEAGSTMYLKRVSADKDLTVTYLNNDSATESSFILKADSNEKLAINSPYNGVPFVKTLYETDTPVVIGIEIANNEKIHKLPYYYYHDNEQAFFTYWKSLPNSYGVIDNKSTMTLLPYGDQDKLVNYYGNCHHSLDEYLEYWDDVMDQYDEFLGLEYDPIDPIDQNVKTKYFFKANAHGAGAAYYAGDHVGINSASAASLFEQNWGGLHEVGHGYQGSLGSTGMGLGEVSNNILGHYVQMNYYDQIYDYQNYWLGNVAGVEQAYNEERRMGIPMNSLEVKERLYVLINLLDTYDPKQTYAEINKIWRRARQEGRTLNNQDAYVEAFASLYNVNVIPYFESWGAPVQDRLKKELANLPVLSTLGDIVTDPTHASDAKNALNKEGIFSLVTNQEVASLGMTSHTTMQLNIDNMNEIMGKKVVVTNNENYTQEIIITGNTISLSDIPIGAYEVILPVPKTNIYEYSKYNYIMVSDTDTFYTFDYLNKVDSVSDFLALDDIIKLNGLGDWTFAQITFDDGNINIKNNSGQPHSYFNDNLYAEIKVLDLEGTVVYHQIYLGDTSYSASQETIPYVNGYKIIITHKEAPSRLKITSQFLQQEESNLTKNDDSENVYIIGKYGLYQNTEAESYNHYQEKIDSYAQKLTDTLSEQEISHKEEAIQEKRVLYNSIIYLNDPEKSHYLEKYRYIYNGSAPILEQDIYTYSQNDFINFYLLDLGSDLEDGKFQLTPENFKYQELPLDQTSRPAAGMHMLAYELTDSDGNKTSGVITVHILEAAAPALPESSLPSGDSLVVQSKPTHSSHQSTSSKNNNHYQNNNTTQVEDSENTLEPDTGDKPIEGQESPTKKPTPSKQKPEEEQPAEDIVEQQPKKWIVVETVLAVSLVVGIMVASKQLRK